MATRRNDVQHGTNAAYVRGCVARSVGAPAQADGWEPLTKVSSTRILGSCFAHYVVIRNGDDSPHTITVRAMPDRSPGTGQLGPDQEGRPQQKHVRARPLKAAPDQTPHSSRFFLGMSCRPHQRPLSRRPQRLLLLNSQRSIWSSKGASTRWLVTRACCPRRWRSPRGRSKKPA
jgi:hypothetical protein